MQPRLTVVLVSYNCAEMLDACLASLRSQRDIDLAVIVVDNASHDESIEMVKSSHPWIADLIENDVNVGFGAACNQALSRIDDGHVLLLNPDTVVPEGALAACVEALLARPQVGVLGCKLVKTNGDVDHACRRSIPTPMASLMYMLRIDRTGLMPSRSPYVDSSWYEQEGEAGAINGAFMLARDDALADVGGFDEQFWMYGEDLDWCVRFREKGWSVHYWPGVSVIHHKGGTSGASRSLRVNWEFHHAMWIFYRKHQARRYNRLVTGMVGIAIAIRFCLSTIRSSVRRLIGAPWQARTNGSPVAQ